MKYEENLPPELVAALPELVGKFLVCHCTPLPCHGDVLVRLLEKFYGGSRNQG
jgi:hypothetical protein